MTTPHPSRTGAAPLVSVVICTHNRAAYLKKALESLRHQTLDASSFEVLVIDNRSTDATKAVFDEIAGHNFTYVFEPELGLSKARNTGWQRGRAPYIAYLDDDAIAAPEWVEFIARAFETTPVPGAVGGRILPIWEAPRPAWLSDRIALALTILDWSDQPHFLGDEQWLAGANITYPRALLEQTGGFDVTLGRRGKNLISCEESLLNGQILALGHRLFYEPRASVQHHIPASRLTRQWHIQRQYWNGVSMATALQIQTPLSRGNRLKRSWQVLSRDVVQQASDLIRKSRTLKDDERFELRCLLTFNFGYIAGLLVRRAA